MFTNRFAELDSLLAIGNGIFEGGSGYPQTSGCNVDTSNLHGTEKVVKSFAFLTPDQICSRNTIVFETQLTGFQAFISQLIQIPYNIESRAFFGNKQTDAFMSGLDIFIGFYKQREGVSMTSVGDEHF